MLSNIVDEDLSTLDDWPAIAGFSILAFRGILAGRDRESLLSGSTALAQRGRKNINGSNVVIAAASKMGPRLHFLNSDDEPRLLGALEAGQIDQDRKNKL